MVMAVFLLSLILLGSALAFPCKNQVTPNPINPNTSDVQKNNVSWSALWEVFKSIVWFVTIVWGAFTAAHSFFINWEKEIQANIKARTLEVSDSVIKLARDLNNFDQKATSLEALDIAAIQKAIKDDDSAKLLKVIKKANKVNANDLNAIQLDAATLLVSYGELAIPVFINSFKKPQINDDSGKIYSESLAKIIRNEKQAYRKEADDLKNDYLFKLFSRLGITSAKNVDDEVLNRYEKLENKLIDLLEIVNCELGINEKCEKPNVKKFKVYVKALGIVGSSMEIQGSEMEKNIIQKAKAKTPPLPINDVMRVQFKTTIETFANTILKENIKVHPNDEYLSKTVEVVKNFKESL
jgi:hypothetical protein